MFNLLWVLVVMPVINEVMANPMGSETGSGSPGDRNEFVEIYNPSDTPVDLSQFFIADRMEVDEIVPFPDTSILEIYPNAVISTVIPPHGYGVILDREYMTEGNGQYLHPYNIPAGAVLMSTGDTDIGNGLSNTDTIRLIDAQNFTVDLYPAPFRPEDGVSVERRQADENIWLPSRTGCTPGYRNSVSIPLDLAIEPTSFRVDPSFPTAGDVVTLSFDVVNYGIEDLSGFSVFRVCEGDTLLIRIDSLLASNDTMSVSMSLGEFDAEQYLRLKVGVMCAGDEDTANNFRFVEIPIGISPLIVNEIDYSSSVEWIELYNRGQTPFDPSGIFVMDRSGNRSERIGAAQVPPSGFVVIAGDSSFGNVFPGVDFIFLRSFPSLNNNGDDVILFNASGIALDSVPYKPSWGGRDGKSIERVSPEIIGWEAYNWMESKSPNGATPGARNSVSVDVHVPEGRLISIQKTVLNPHRGDKLVVFYRSEIPPEKIRLKIYDEIGRKCMDVEEDRMAQEGQIVVDVSQLQNGLYIAYFSLTTVLGRTYRAKKTFTVMKR